jgi:UPF0755 protein
MGPVADPTDPRAARPGAAGGPPRRGGPPTAPPPGPPPGRPGLPPPPAAPPGTQVGPGYRDPTGEHEVYADNYGDDVYINDMAGYDEDDEDAEYYDDALENGKPRRRRLLIALLVFLLLVGGGGFVAWTWLQRQIDPPGPQGDTVTVEIAEGSSTGDIGDALADSDVIVNATVWDWYTRLKNVGSIQAGQYELQENSSIQQAIAALEAGPAAPIGRFVTIPEGYTVEQTVGRIADPENGIEGFTAERLQAQLSGGRIRSRFLPPDARSAEGTLFPETYRLEEDEDEAALLTMMVEQFDAVMADLDAEARAAALGRTPYEILIVASMVEKEASVDAERGQVARVIYNRLDQEQPLGIDATSCYETGEIPCQLTSEQLESDSPYNTRNRTGLPPTPISSPGRASIEAALNPAQGDWLFYVLDADANDGRHVFTSSYDEFLAARERCQQADLC